MGLRNFSSLVVFIHFREGIAIIVKLYANIMPPDGEVLLQAKLEQR